MVGEPEECAGDVAVGWVPDDALVGGREPLPGWPLEAGAVCGVEAGLSVPCQWWVLLTPDGEPLDPLPGLTV